MLHAKYALVWPECGSCGLEELCGGDWDELAVREALAKDEGRMSKVESRELPRCWFWGKPNVGTILLATVGLVALVVATSRVGSIAFADGPAKLTAEQRQALEAEANRLWTEAKRLDAQDKVEDAIILAETMLAIDRERSGGFHQDIAFDLGWLAERYERRGDLPAAIEARQEAVSIQVQLLGQE